VELDGASLLPIIRDDAPSHHAVMHWGWYDQWVVREGDWKLIGTGDEPTELVNLAEENPERTNHAQDQPELVARLLAMHLSWLAEVTPQDTE